MRKTKLMLVAFAAMFGLSSQAQKALPVEAIGFVESESTDTYYYLYNVDAGLFFTEGNAWGTQFSLGEDGLKVAFTAAGDNYPNSYFFNDYSLAKNAWKKAFFDTKTQMFVDLGAQSRFYWGVETSSDGTTFRLFASSDNPDWGENDPAYQEGYYVGWDSNSTSSACSPYLEDVEGNYITWALMTEEGYNSYKAKAKYQSLKDAIVALDNAIDISAAETAIASATTVEGVEEAIDMLREAVSTYLSEQQDVEIDVTALYVINPSFENGTTGWTYQASNDSGAKENSNATYTVDNADGAYVFNIWSSGNPISQTITGLPNGNYKMMALIATDAGHQVQLNANTQSVVVDASEEGKGHGVDGEVEFTVLDGTATIGAEGVDKYWYKVDNFRLYFLGALTDLTPYAERLAEVVAEAEAIEAGSIPTAAYETLQTIIDDYNKEWDSAEEYDWAIDAIRDAIDEAKEMVAPYAAFLTLKEIAQELVAANSDNAAGQADLRDAITTQSDEVEGAEEADDIEDAIEELKEEMTDYANSSNPVGDGVMFNLTFMLTNPDLTNVPGWAPAEGWYNDQTQPTQNSQVMNSNNAVANSADPTKFAMYEYWSAGTEPTEGYVVYQKVTLPEGTYKMTALAFAGFGGGHRYGYQTDGDHGLGPLGDGSPNITFSAGEIDGTPITTPTLEDASIDFVQEVEGEVKIGLKAHAGNRSNWMGIGYVQLFKVQSVEIEIDEDVAFEPESVAGKVSLKRTLNADKWNTFAVPFSITNEELIDAFGEGTEVAEFSETLATEITENEAGEEVETPIENESIISFDKMETPAITANRPVLLKPASVDANGEYVFYNRTVAAGFPFVAGLNFEFVGNYNGEITLEEGDYFLNGGKIYESNGTNNLKGTRAYIAAKAEGARIVGFFIDGVSDNATAIEGLQINSDFAGKLYNLNGQQVKSAKKGLYIRDGKKVVVK